MKLNRTVLKTKLLNNFIKAVSVSKHQKFKLKSYPNLNALYYIIYVMVFFIGQGTTLFLTDYKNRWKKQSHDSISWNCFKLINNFTLVAYVPLVVASFHNQPWISYHISFAQNQLTNI